MWGGVRNGALALWRWRGLARTGPHVPAPSLFPPRAELFVWVEARARHFQRGDGFAERRADRGGLRVAAGHVPVERKATAGL